jgi:hypothetical protein
MDRYIKLKEVIKNIVREEMMGEATKQATIDYTDPNKPDKILNVDPADKGTIDTIKRDSTIKSATIGTSKIKEMAAPTTATYALKDDADERLKDYLSRINPKKTSVKKIVTKMVDILKTEENASVGDLFNKLRDAFANDPETLSKLKATVNVKGWLWGGVNSDEFNRRYTQLINPATGEKWEPGDLNAISWTPFVRSKDKRLTDFEKAQQLATTDPEAFAQKQASFKKSDTLAEKVLDYKFLRADYFTKGSQNRADVKINKSLKGKQGEITSAEKMANMLNDDLAVALLYQWKEGYLEAGIDEPLKDYANENGLLDGKKPEGLTEKYSEIVTKLISSNQLKKLGKKEFSPKKKGAPMSKDDIEAYYKSIGMDVPDDEKVDLTGVDTIFGDEEGDEEEV